MDEFTKTTKDAGHTEELKRLTGNHYVYKDGMGKLVLAPIDMSRSDIRVLDSAAADGTWLRDLGCPGELVGTDIEPELFPQDLPSNMKMTKQNINEPWPSEWRGSFDLVHQRLGLGGTAGSVSGPENAVRNLAALVKPGGWLQLVEMNVFDPPRCGPASNDMMRLISEIFSGVGLGDFAQNLKPMLEGTGIVDIQERRFRCASGAKARPEIREGSIIGSSAAVAPLVAVAKNIPTTFTADELETLEDRVEEELRRKGSEFEMIAVWGQKK